MSFLAAVKSQSKPAGHAAMQSSIPTADTLGAKNVLLCLMRTSLPSSASRVLRSGRAWNRHAARNRWIGSTSDAGKAAVTAVQAGSPRLDVFCGTASISTVLPGQRAGNMLSLERAGARGMERRAAQYVRTKPTFALLLAPRGRLVSSAQEVFCEN